MIYCFSQVSGHQLPGNNLLWKQHERCQWTNDNLICSSQPKLGCYKIWSSGSENEKKYFIQMMACLSKQTANRQHCTLKTINQSYPFKTEGTY